MYSSGITYTGVSSVSPGPPLPTNANDGLSLVAGNVQLGQLAGIGQGGPADLLDNREIPFNGQTISLGVFPDAASGNVGTFTSLLKLRAILQIFDVDGTLAMQFDPSANVTTDGSANTDLTNIAVTGTYNYTAGAANRQYSFWSTTVLNGTAGNTFFGAFIAVDVSHFSGAFTGQYVAFLCNADFHQPNTPVTVTLRGFYHNPVVPPGAAFAAGITHIAFENVEGDCRFCSNNATPATQGKMGIGLGAGIAPTALLDLGAASGGATGFGIMKFHSGPLLTTPQDGTWEYDGVHLYFTIGAVRNTII